MNPDPNILNDFFGTALKSSVAQYIDKEVERASVGFKVRLREKLLDDAMKAIAVVVQKSDSDGVYITLTRSKERP